MSKFSTDQITCLGENPNLCNMIPDASFCTTYETLSGGDCSWDGDSCEGTTLCEQYYSVFQACPPPCELTVSDQSGTVGGRLRFRIFKDLPSAGKYGQYFHTNDYDMFIEDTGIITPDTTDDLYTTKDLDVTPFNNSNIESIFKWQPDNIIKTELHSLLWDAPFKDVGGCSDGTGVYGYVTQYEKFMKVGIVDSSTYNSADSYSDLHTIFSGMSIFAGRDLYNDGEVTSCQRIDCNSCGQNNCNYNYFGPVGGGAYPAGYSGWALGELANDEGCEEDCNSEWVRFNEINYFSHLSADSNVYLINNINYENFAPGNEWGDFLSSDDKLLVIGHYFFLEYCAGWDGTPCGDNKFYGTYAIPSAEIREIMQSGQDAVLDVHMDKLYSDGGYQFHLCDAGDDEGGDGEGDYCCGTYDTKCNDGDVCVPFYMESTWWANGGGSGQTADPDPLEDGLGMRPYQRFKFFASDLEDEDLEGWNYHYFYNIGGRRISDLLSETYWVDASEDFGGYNIRYPDEWVSHASGEFSELAGKQIRPEHMYTDWRPIPHVFIGDTEYYDNGVYIQKYYDFLDAERPLASAPNIVNLNMYIADNSGLNVINYVSYYDEVYKKYQEAVEALGGEMVVASGENHQTNTYCDCMDNTDCGDGQVCYFGYNGCQEISNNIGVCVYPEAPETRTPPACCTQGSGQCNWTCSGGVMLSFNCSCTPGAYNCNPPQGPCYSSGSCQCTCPPHLCDDGGDPIVGCSDPDASNYRYNCEGEFVGTPDYDDGCCEYYYDIDFSYIDEYIELDFVGISDPDCSIPYNCTSESTITFEIETYCDWEDWTENVDYTDEVFYIEEFIPSLCIWELEMNLGDGYHPVLFDLEGGGQNWSHQVAFTPDEIYTITIAPEGTPQYSTHYSDFWYEGTGNYFFNESNPGGINWINVGGLNEYPKIRYKTQYHNEENYQVIWEESLDITGLGPKTARLNEGSNFIIHYPGCMDPFGDQYNMYAYPDNGTCTYTEVGCTDPEAINYDPSASTDDGSCVYPGDYGFDTNPVESSIISEEALNFIGVDEPYVQNHIQKLKMFVVNWNHKIGDPDFDTLVFPENQTSVELERLVNNTFDDVDVFDVLDEGKINFLSHQYNTPGIKIIKAVVLSTTVNDSGDILPLTIKCMTIKINLSLDTVYIEDFAETGGPDFKFLPFDDTTPVISGISPDSEYVTSMEQILDENQFSEADQIDKVNLEKSFHNQEIGSYLGESAIQQVRYFKKGNFDIPTLLGIESYYENFLNPFPLAFSYNDFHPYHEFWFWDGFNNKYPEETSIGSIFIDDAVHPPNIKRECLLELNMGESDGRVVVDTSGNGNKGILIGDYKLSKPSLDIPIRRESQMNLPDIKEDDEKAL